jgi:long-chain acyl-CoA synthetase
MLFKEALVPLHGHNISPAALEAELTAACPAITHACVIGEGRPHLSPIIEVDPSTESPPGLIGAAIQQVNAARDPRERIENYLITGEEWNIGQELTETLKLRRDQIARRYATEIEHLNPNETEPDAPPAATGPGSGGPDGTARP